jgi:transposase InsO family protein
MPRHFDLFTSLMQARQALEEWRRDYNLVRPHSSIGWLAPATYAATFSPPRGHAMFAEQIDIIENGVWRRVSAFEAILLQL